MATTANPSLGVYLRIEGAAEQQIGAIGVPLALKTTSGPAGLNVTVRLVDAAPDRIRERLVAVLRETADAMEHAGAAP